MYRRHLSERALGGPSLLFTPQTGLFYFTVDSHKQRRVKERISLKGWQSEIVVPFLPNIPMSTMIF